MALDLDASRLNLYTSEKELYSPVDAITLPAVNAPDTLCSPFFTSATKEPVMFGSPAFTVVPAAWLLSNAYSDTLLPMGIASPCGSILSAVICVVAFTVLDRRGAFDKLVA